MEGKGSDLETAAQVYGTKTDDVFVQVIYFFGEVKIFLGYRASCGVGREAQMNGAIADVDVWVMIGGFGQLANLHDQRQCLDEAGALDRAGQGLVGLGPA